MSDNATVMEGGAAAEGKKSGGGLKIALLVGIPLILIGAAVGVLFFTSFGQGLLGHHPEKEHTAEAAPSPDSLVYFPIPEILVNLLKSNPKQRAAPFLRLTLKLELPDKESEKLMQTVLPRVIDQFQVYLRQLRVEDIEGSAGLQRLREELLKRVNEVTTPTKVRDVLFEVFLVQ